MKKVLLPILAICAATPAFADEVYGTTPETAKPFPAYVPGSLSNGWRVESLDNVPDEVYFTYKYDGETPAQWGDIPGADANAKMIWVYLCNDGKEALQRAEGSNSYAFMPGQEYLIKITPKAVGTYGAYAPMAFPAAWEGVYKYYPKNISDAPYLTQFQKPGTTAWYLYDVPYANQLDIQIDSRDASGAIVGNKSDITTVEAIHIECPGGTNYSTSIGSFTLLPYVKAGRNVIGVTVSENAPEAFGFHFTLNAISILNCGNKLAYDAGIKVDEEVSYPDAYYTVDRLFTVPEDGTYTFTNHGAAGTILNVGFVEYLPTDPNDPYAGKPFTCLTEGMKTATVGNGDAVVVFENLKKGDAMYVQSDAFGVIGAGDAPYIKVTKGGTSGIDNVTSDGNSLNVNVNGAKLSVESVLLASGAEVAVYDMTARKVASAVAAAGADRLEMNLNAAPGVYVVVVYGKGNSESGKIVIK